MTRTINIEVYSDDGEAFAILSEHRPDLPKPFDEQLQEWAKAHFGHLEEGDTVEEAGEFVYEPNGEIAEMRVK